MKNILVPIDFSDTSKDAFLYAQSFVEENANFMVLHAYHPQADPAYPYLQGTTESFYKKKETDLKAFAVTNHPSTDGSLLVDTFVSPLFKIGLAGDVIVEESKKETDLIVLGRTGTNSVFEKVFGTTSTHVAQNAACPVLLVPKGTVFKGIKKILFATNKAICKETGLLQQLLATVGSYRPEIHFVQVKNDLFNYYQLENEVEQLSDFFKKNAPGITFKIKNINSDYALAGLHEYAKEQGVDMITIATEHRDTLGQLFHRSMTKRMVLNSEIPLLVIHS